MAINFPNLPRFTPQEGGSLPDLQQAIMQGIGNFMQPKQMAQDFLKRELINKMLGTQAQYAEPMAQASLQQKLMEQQFAPQLNQARLELLEAQKQKQLQPSMQQELLPYQIELTKAKTKAATLPKAGKMTAYEQKREAGGGVLDYLTPVIQKQPYIGTFASSQVASDLAAYKKDPKAKERLIDYATASGLIPEHTSGALSSQGLQTTVDALKHQRQATTQGWPMFYEKQVAALPKEIQVEAKKRIAKHQMYLKKPQKIAAQAQVSEQDPLGLFQ
jgi:hypothetical protein